MTILRTGVQPGSRRGFSARAALCNRPLPRGERRSPRWMLLATALLIAILSVEASAAVYLSAEDRRAVSLPQLIAIARRDNKNLQTARYAVAIGRARLLQAGLRPNPRLDLSTRSDVLFGNEGDYGNAVGITQEFPIAGRLLRQKDVARIDIAMAETEVADAERRLVGEVASQTYRIAMIDRRIGSFDVLADVEQRLAKTTRERFKAAEVSELDVNTVQLDLQRLVQERAMLQNEKQSLLLSLNTLLGRAATAPLTIVEPLPRAEFLPDLPRLQQTALTLRPDLAGAMLGIDRAFAEKALARSLRWQDWSVGVELSQDKQVITGAPPQGSSRAIGLSVSIPLPWVNKSQGLIAEAEANRDQATARVDALRLSIVSEVTGAHAEIRRLDAALAQYDKSARPVIERNVRLAQDGYRQGLIPLLDVVQAQRQQAEWQATYLTTLEQSVQAIVRLHTAVGDYLSAAAAPAPHKKD